MINKEELLNSINESIKDNFKKNVIIGNLSHIENISNVGSGQLKINKKFNLILSNPLLAFEWNEIRCCLCNRVISYPCWYYSIKYAVNHFHYFICFDKDSPSKPSVKCYKRDV